MASERATRGGGREVSLPSPGANPGFSMNFGYSTGQGAGAGWFGPGEPMTPQAPEQVAGRAFDFPSNLNILTTQRTTSPITYDTLRNFADGYDLLRLIIETRKDAMERLSWVIKHRDPTEKLSTQKKNKIKDLTKFFQKPDGEHKWGTWLRMLLEDVFVIDAATLHRRRNRVGNKLISLDQIDGSTMRRVLDDWGRTPEGEDDTCYQQILKGVPAINYRKRDIYYRPRNVRVHKVYGYSPVEQILMTVNIALRRQIFQLNFFTEGNMPPALIGVPEAWTPDQIKTFQEWFDNILAGNLAERRRARFVPSAVGKTYIPTQETELFGKAEEWLARVCCFAFSVSPQPFMAMMNRSTADNAQREAAATGLQPIQKWVKELIDDILEEDLDAEDYEFCWRGDDELDPLKRQQITEGYTKMGLLTVNEGRADIGRDPYDDPRFDEPLFMTSNGMAPMFLTAEAQGGPDRDPVTGEPVNPALEAPEEDEEDTGIEDQVLKINQLVAEGDLAKLTEFLSTQMKEDDDG